MLAALCITISIKKNNYKKYCIDEGKVQVKLRIEGKSPLPETRTFFEISKKGAIITCKRIIAFNW